MNPALPRNIARKNRGENMISIFVKTKRSKLRKGRAG